MTGPKADNAGSEAISRHPLHSTATTDGARAHDPKDQTMDSVWVENLLPIPKCSLRNHCIDLLLRQVLEQLCCTEPCSGGHQLKTRGQATDHRGRIQPRGTQRLQP